MKVALKYCGSCNPQVELGPIGRRLRALAGSAVTFVTLGDGEADLVVILNGCLTACADRMDVRGQAREAVVVAGTSVGLEAVPEEQLAARVAAMILGKV